MEAGHTARGDRIGERRGDFGARPAGGERAHEHARAVLPGPDGVHADAVAEQRPAALAPRRIDREHGDIETVVLVEPEAADQLVGQRGLARPAGAGNAERGDGQCVGLLQHLLSQPRRLAVLQRGDHSRERAAVSRFHRLQVLRRVLREILVAAGEHVVDHALQAQLPAVLGRIDARDAVSLELADFLGHDHPAAAAEHFDVLPPSLAQELDHVLEVLDMAALIRGNRDALHVLLERGGDDLLGRAVVAEVDDLAAARLQDAANDVDGGVVAVEQRRRGHEADLVFRLVFGTLRPCAQVCHGCPGTSRSAAGEKSLRDVYVNVKKFRP